MIRLFRPLFAACIAAFATTASGATLVPIEISIGAVQLAGAGISRTGTGGQEVTISGGGASGSALISIREEPGSVVFEQSGDYTGGYRFGGTVEISFIVPSFGPGTTAVAIRPTLEVDDPRGRIRVEGGPLYTSSVLGAMLTGEPFGVGVGFPLPGILASLDEYIAGDEVTFILDIPNSPSGFDFFDLGAGSGTFLQRVRLEAFAVMGGGYPHVPEPQPLMLATAVWSVFLLRRRQGARAPAAPSGSLGCARR